MGDRPQQMSLDQDNQNPQMNDAAEIQSPKKTLNTLIEILQLLKSQQNQEKQKPDQIETGTTGNQENNDSDAEKK